MFLHYLSVLQFAAVLKQTDEQKFLFPWLTVATHLTSSHMCFLYPKASIRVIRKMAGWEIEDYLTNVLGSFDEEMIKRAMENIKA